MSDNELVSPELWVKAYGDYLFGYAKSRVFETEVCEDLVQETFLSALKAKDNFKGKSSAKTWLIGILKNKIIDHMRKKYASGIMPTTDYDEEYIEKGISAEHWKSDMRPKVWEKLTDTETEQNEFMRILKRCLDKLPNAMKATFILREMEDLETQEICKELGISESNLWVLLHRSRKALRKCVEKNYLIAS